MPDELKTKILDVTPTVTTVAGQGTVPGMQVKFTVGDHGPYYLTVPDQGYTADAVKKAVETKATEIRKTLS